MSEYLVASRTRTRNGFGLYEYVFINRQGEAVRAFKSDTFPVNTVIQVPGADFSALGFECVRQIGEKMPAEALKRAWDRVGTGEPPVKKLPAVPSFTEIMQYEDGGMDEETMIEFFQRLINSGLAWQLQGCYGRQAAQLIEAGLCHK